MIDLQINEVAVFSRDLGTLPIFRSRHDHVLAKKLFNAEHRSGLCDVNCQGWKVDSRLGLFNMASDSELFSEKPQWEVEEYSMEIQSNGQKLVPLYEGKFLSHFDHRFSSYHNLGKEKGRGGRGLPPVKIEEYQNRDFEILPRYWVKKNLVEQKLLDLNWQRDWLLGWRDVANSKVERTVTFAFIPRTAVGHTCSLLFPSADASLSACLCANLNSLVLDYAARQIVGGSHVTFGYLRQLPLLNDLYYSKSRSAFVVSRVLELTYTSHSMAPFASDLGYDGQPFVWDEDRRAILRADLDAFYARAYGLDRNELRYILDPADIKGVDYPSETFRVLKEREIRQFKKYRTHDLVLEAWDRMMADGTFAAMGMTEVVSTPATRPIRVQLPPLDQIPDGAWGRANPSPQHDPGAALAAILKSLDGPTLIRTVRLAAAMMLEPHLLTPLLPKSQAAQWKRLVGQEAEPRTGNVVGFAARTNSGWGTAVSNHRGNERLIEDLSAGTWASGKGLEQFVTTGWPEGRAAFVFDAISTLDLDATITSLPDEIRGWIAHAAAA